VVAIADVVKTRNAPVVQNVIAVATNKTKQSKTPERVFLIFELFLCGSSNFF